MESAIPGNPSHPLKPKNCYLEGTHTGCPDPQAVNWLSPASKGLRENHQVASPALQAGPGPYRPPQCRWAQPDGALWFSPLGPATTTSRGATPALLVSTVKDCGTLARTAVPRPGPAIFTLLGSTTSFTGTLKGLPGS